MTDRPRRAVRRITYAEHRRAAVELAGPLRRFVGEVVDMVVLAIITMSIFAIARPPGHDRGAPFVIAIWVLGAGYQVVPVALWGRTPGKLVAGTRVARDPELGSPGWVSATTRWIVVIAPQLLVAPLPGAQLQTLWFRLLNTVWWIVVYIGIFTDPRRRGLHDRAARTIVVMARA